MNFTYGDDNLGNVTFPVIKICMTYDYDVAITFNFVSLRTHAATLGT